MTDSPTPAALIHHCLETLADEVASLSPTVYARFFQRQPQAEVLFGNDGEDLLKTDMLTRLLVQILEFAEGQANPELIVSWAADHAGYGVDLVMFPAMFDSLAETLREATGEAWTPAVERAWQIQFDGLLTLIRQAFRSYQVAMGG